MTDYPYYSHLRANEVCAGLYNEGHLMRLAQYTIEYEFTILSVSDGIHKWHADGTGDSLEEFGIISISDNDTGHPMIHFADYPGDEIKSFFFEVDHRAVNAPSSKILNGVFDLYVYRWPHNSILDQLYYREISYKHFFFEISKIGGWNKDLDWETYIEMYPELAEEEDALKNSQHD